MIRSTLLLVVAAAISGADAFAPVGMAARANTQLFMVSYSDYFVFFISKRYLCNGWGGGSALLCSNCLGSHHTYIHKTQNAEASLTHVMHVLRSTNFNIVEGLRNHLELGGRWKMFISICHRG